MLFLDINGGFDNVNPSTLCSILKAKAVIPYLVSWTRSFLTCTCRLRYQRSPKVFAPVSVGTPQGSPVSPLLFVIYVSRLHCEIPQGLTLSYVDDFGVMVSSMSYRRNIQSLQRHYAVLKVRGARLGDSFSIPKTEVIHWRTIMDRGPVSSSLIPPDGSIFPPKARSVGWDTGSPRRSPRPHTLPRDWPRPKLRSWPSKGSPPRGWAFPRPCATGWPPLSSAPS